MSRLEWTLSGEQFYSGGVTKIPKRGKPVAKRISVRADSARLIGALEGRIKIKGDIFSTGVRSYAGQRGN